jgi:hypothetical protein
VAFGERACAGLGRITGAGDELHHIATRGLCHLKKTGFRKHSGIWAWLFAQVDACSNPSLSACCTQAECSAATPLPHCTCLLIHTQEEKWQDPFLLLGFVPQALPVMLLFLLSWAVGWEADQKMWIEHCLEGWVRLNFVLCAAANDSDGIC